MSESINITVNEKRRIAILVSRRDGNEPLIVSGTYKVVQKDGTELISETPVDGIESAIFGTIHKKRVWALIDFTDTIFESYSIVYVCFWIETSSDKKINGRVRINIGECAGGW